jgi:hypothetical protein
VCNMMKVFTRLTSASDFFSLKAESGLCETQIVWQREALVLNLIKICFI